MLCVAYFPPNGDEWGVYLFLSLFVFFCPLTIKILSWAVRRTDLPDWCFCLCAWVNVDPLKCFSVGPQRAGVKLQSTIYSARMSSHLCRAHAPERMRKGTHTVRRNVLTVSNPTPDDDLLRLNTAQHDCLLWQGTNACEARPRLTSMRAL